MKKYKHQQYITHGNTKNGLTGFSCELCRYEFRGRVKYMDLTHMFRKVLLIKVALVSIFNSSALIYLIYSIWRKKFRVFQQLKEIWTILNVYQILKILPAVLRLSDSLLSLGTYCASLSIMIMSCWQLFQRILAEFRIIEIESI